MVASIPVEEAQAKLKELIDNLLPGEEIVITRNEIPIAKLVSEPTLQHSRPAPGLGRGAVVYIAPDFDEPMDEFGEYTE